MVDEIVPEDEAPKGAPAYFDKPDAPKRARKPKDTGNGAEVQEVKPIGEALKSHLKLVDELQAAAAPAPDPLNRNPAVGSGPDPYDLNSAVYDQSYLENAAVEDVDRPLKVRKPKKKEFFRVLPYYQCYNFYVDEEDGKIDKDYYIVMPPMAVAMEGETFKAELRLCVNTHEVAFLWPRRVPEEGDKSSANWETGDAVTRAETHWLRMMPKNGEYHLKVAKGELDEPKFPATDAEGYKRVVNASVPRERRIGDREHEIFYYKVEGRKR